MQVCRCTLCKKERTAFTWDYVQRKNVTGRVAQYTPGTDTVYKVGGREVGRERNTSYGVGNKTITASQGTAAICFPCRLLWSAVLAVVLFVLLSLAFFLFLLLVFKLFEENAAAAVWPYMPTVMKYIAVLVGLFALTPWMKHLILKLYLAKQFRIRPFWSIVSKFWG